MNSNGEPFHFLPTAPDVLFCKGLPSMKKVMMTIQPDLLQSASRRRQASAIVSPRVLTKKRKMITRRVIKKSAQASPSPSESNTNQVTHLSKTSSLLHTYIHNKGEVFRKMSYLVGVRLWWTRGSLCWFLDDSPRDHLPFLSWHSGGQHLQKFVFV